MIVVISDLHFEECRQDALNANSPPIQPKRNIQPAAFDRVFDEIARDARKREVLSIDLVLAGDIFDMHRTQMWFTKEGGLVAGGPYVSNREAASNKDLQDHLVKIFEAITGQGARGAAHAYADNNVIGCLERICSFNRIVNPVDDNNKPIEAWEIACRTHYIPGNHDRLLNSTKELRKLVIKALGLHIDDENIPFPHRFPHDGIKPAHHDRPWPRVLIRHGHEYDATNFGCRFGKDELIPLDPDPKSYDAPTLGDFITVDVATRLPFELRRRINAGDYGQPGDPRLDIAHELYSRLLEFDDVRPQSALLDFVLSIPGGDRDEIWSMLKPVLKAVLKNADQSPDLSRLLKAVDIAWRPDVADAIQFALLTWPALLAQGPDVLSWEVRKLAKRLDGTPTESIAAREWAVDARIARLVIAGHTHAPQTALIDEFREPGIADGEDVFYIDTGTWRNRVLSTRDRRQFGATKTLTYASVYTDKEFDARTPAGQQAPRESFACWTGHRQQWT